jgi:hypothetical protein
VPLRIVQILADDAGALTQRMERAALLVAEDQQTNEAIAAAVGVKRQTVDWWKRKPAFTARVEALRQQFREAIAQEGIAHQQNRINALNERWRLMQQVIAARAADVTMTGAGHETGLLVRTYKPGKYRNLEEYKVDAGLLAELRAHELQAARELGQLVEKRELTGKDGGPLEVEHGGAIEVRAVDYRVTTATLHPLPAALAPGGEEEGAA